MSELLKIVLTACLTIFGGVLVFVMGQVIAKFLIEPIHEQKMVISKIADALIFYANIYSNPDPIPEKHQLEDRNTVRRDEASNSLRQLSALLRSKTHLIPLYYFFEKIRFVKKRSAVEEAASELMGLSNSLYHPAHSINENLGLLNSERAKKIAELLGLRIR